MGQAIIDSMLDLGEATPISAENLDEFTGADEKSASVLFFTGDPVKKLETADLAVVLRELGRKHAGALRVGIVNRGDERNLMKLCRVGTLPSAVFYANGKYVETIPKIQNWSVYEEKVPAIIDNAGAAEGLKQ